MGFTRAQQLMTLHPLSPQPSVAAGSYIPRPPKIPSGLFEKKDWQTVEEIMQWSDKVVAMIRFYDTCVDCKLQPHAAMWNKDTSKAIRYWTHLCKPREGGREDSKGTKVKLHWRNFLVERAPTILASTQWMETHGKKEPHLIDWCRFAFQESARLAKERIGANAVQKLSDNASTSHSAPALPSTPIPGPIKTALITPLADIQVPATPATAFSATSTLGSASPMETPCDKMWGKRKRVASAVAEEKPVSIPSSQPEEDTEKGENESDSPLSQAWEPPSPDGDEAEDKEPTTGPEVPNTPDAIPVNEDDVQSHAIHALITGSSLPNNAKAEVAWWSGMARARPSAICAHLHKLGFDTTRILQISHPKGQDSVALVVLKPCTLNLFQLHLRMLGLDTIAGAPMALSVVPPFLAVLGDWLEWSAPPTPSELVDARARFLDTFRQLHADLVAAKRTVLAEAYARREQELAYLWNYPTKKPSTPSGSQIA
ncbi:hypothetical protein CF326_g5328 [Tilletia indica]|nr:hypothetical protein CF326_g5328 [Tilletia indica]